MTQLAPETLERYKAKLVDVSSPATLLLNDETVELRSSIYTTNADAVNDEPRGRAWQDLLDAW